MFKILHLEGMEGVCHQSANESQEWGCLLCRAQYRGLKDRGQPSPDRPPTARAMDARDRDKRTTGRPCALSKAWRQLPPALDAPHGTGSRGSSGSFQSPSQASPAAATHACREPGAREGDAGMRAHGVYPCEHPLLPPCLQAALGARRLQLDSTARRELSPPTHARVGAQRRVLHPPSLSRQLEPRDRDGTPSGSRRETSALLPIPPLVSAPVRTSTYARSCHGFCFPRTFCIRR